RSRSVHRPHRPGGGARLDEGRVRAGKTGGRGKRSVRNDTAAGCEHGKGGKSGKRAVASGRARGRMPGERREAADPIPRWAATAQRLSPTEVYPPCPSPSGPAHRTSDTADRPLFVRLGEARGGMKLTEFRALVRDASRTAFAELLAQH